MLKNTSLISVCYLNVIVIYELIVRKEVVLFNGAHQTAVTAVMITIVMFIIASFLLAKLGGKLAAAVLIAAATALVIPFIVLTIQSQFIGFWFFVLSGIVLNVIATVANGWRMPGIGYELDADDWRHTTLNEKSRFVFLCDVFDSPFISANCVCSIGDILIYSGIIITTIQLYFSV